MALYFITGIAGSGKSTLAAALKARGYEAYDTDDDGFARWHNNETGYVHPKSSVKKEDRTPDFIQTHSWKVPRQRIGELALNAQDHDIFVCGVASNEDELRDLFATTFELIIDQDTLKHRLATRTNNDWGKQAHELEQTLDAHHNSQIKGMQNGQIAVDAKQSVDAVINDILSYVHSQHDTEG